MCTGGHASGPIAHVDVPHVENGEGISRGLNAQPAVKLPQTNLRLVVGVVVMLDGSRRVLSYEREFRSARMSGDGRAHLGP